ncbi:MAG: response regulator [Flavobacteriales bacterium]
MHRIVIIEDNPEIREAFSLLIAMNDNFTVGGSYESCEEALENLKQDKPDIVLMDIDLPGMSGIQGTQQIKKLYPKISILIITVFENSKTVFDALCAGATGYLTKSSDKEKLMTALDEVVKGGAPMSTHIAKMVVQSFQKNMNSPLTERETEILSLLAAGKSYNNIGDTLFISKDTVKFHLKNIYIKLQVNNRSEAIERANKDKLI